MGDDRSRAAAGPQPAERTGGAGRGALAAILLARFALNVQFRIVYPFLPAISRGLGVPLDAAGLLLTARSLTAMTSPLLGLLADRFGRRTLMLGGLAALVAGCLLVAAAPAFAWVFVAFALLGLAKAAYDPAMQAAISDSVPYDRRGRVLAVLELSWSLAWLLGVPAAGFLIAAAGWHAPFLAVAGLGALCLALLARSIAAERGRSAPPAGASRKPLIDEANPAPRPSLLGRQGGTDGAPSAGATSDRAVAVAHAASMVGEEPAAGPHVAPAAYLARWAAAARALGSVVWLALLVNLLQVLAIENVFVVYGAWLEDRFGLSVTALGLAASVIAIAEFVAEGGAAGLVDRIGKRPAVLAGLLVSVLAYLLLPHVAGGLVTALAGTCLLFLAFEFGMVASLPLMSELAPTARATLMALNVAAMSLGRVIASLTGPRLWEAGGLPANTAVSAAIAIVAAAILWLGVRELRPAR